MTGAFITFALAAALVVLIPGPDTLVVLRAMVLSGRRAAAMTALGVLTGLTVWMAAATLGLTALMRASRDGYLVLRLAGAAYLLFMGVQALRSRVLGQVGAPAAAPRPLIGRGYRAGLLTDLLNPKVGVFFVTFLPALVPHHAPITTVTLGFGAVFVAETALYFAVMVIFVRRLTTWLDRERVRRSLNRATGLVLIGFGLRLAAEG